MKLIFRLSLSFFSAALVICLFFYGNGETKSLNQQGQKRTYPIVDTGQNRCYSDSREIPYPKKGEPFYGQDAQYTANSPSYSDNGDGTVTDLVTGLMWQKTPDLKNKSTFDNALANARNFRLAGYNDWRLPTIKELYSLIDFRGYITRSVSRSRPFLDTRYFDFVYGDESKGERTIDAQYFSSTNYVGRTMGGDETIFGVNFADGRIKGYPKYGRRSNRDKRFVRYVRGKLDYGKNNFTDNGDGTVTDHATGLTWMKNDSGSPLNWQQALAFAESLTHAGHDNWRLPNAKELQSIVDYSRAPDASDSKHRSAAMNPIFNITKMESYFWTSTTHIGGPRSDAAVYICFGRAMGQMHGHKMNVHGAGAQRSDPKSGNPGTWANGRGPQGDDVRIYNYVRAVRGGNVRMVSSGPPVNVQFSPDGPPRQRNNQQQFQGSGRPSGDRSGPRSNRQQLHKRQTLPGPGGHGFVSRLDKDGDNRVSRKEFDGPPNHFDFLDRNKDGYLSEAERPPGPPPQNRRAF